MDANSREDLEDFVRRVDKVGRSPLFAARTEISLQLNWQRGGPLQATTTEPDEETREAFVARLRPVLLEKERTSLRHVFDLCELNLRDDALRLRVREIRREWKFAQREGVFKVIINEEHWQPERVAHLVINAEMAHDDRDKRRQLEALHPIAGAITRQSMLHFLMDTANAAFKLAAVVRFALAEHRF